MTGILKEIDRYYRETPPDVEANRELDDKLANIEIGLNERQLKALK